MHVSACPIQSLVCLLLCIHLAASQAIHRPPICNSNYGHPQLSDCQALLRLIAPPSQPETPAARFFAQEELAYNPDNSWPGVENVFPHRIIQLPKLLTSKSCNVALVGFTRATTGYAAAISSWASVGRVLIELQNECIDDDREGGSRDRFGGRQFVNSNLNHHPVFVLFVWETGAPFEQALNRLMTVPEEFSGKFHPPSRYGAAVSEVVGGTMEMEGGRNGTTVGFGNPTPAPAAAASDEPVDGLVEMIIPGRRGTADTVLQL